jgi:hypothetical protein
MTPSVHMRHFEGEFWFLAPNLRRSSLSVGEGRNTHQDPSRRNAAGSTVGSVRAHGQCGQTPCAHRVSRRLRRCPNGHRRYRVSRSHSPRPALAAHAVPHGDSAVITVRVDVSDLDD